MHLTSIPHKGTKGELAQAFGDLVRGMWEGKHSCIYPRDFLDVLCDHAQQFLGYEQHDRWALTAPAAFDAVYCSVRKLS